VGGEHNACDPAGTLTAIVHYAAVKYVWSEDLIEMLAEEQEQREQREAESPNEPPVFARSRGGAGLDARRKEPDLQPRRCRGIDPIES